MLKEYFAGMKMGITAYWKAHKVIRELRLWNYFIAPIIAGIIFSAGFYFLAQKIGAAMASEGDYLFEIEWYRRLNTWLVTVMYWPFMLWLYTVSFKYVVLAMISPLLARLSATVEQKMKGTPPPKFSFKQTYHDISRALRLALRNLVWETGIGVVLFILPWVRTWLLFGVSSFYSGYSIMDYTLERKRYTIPESIEFMRANRGVALGLGIPFYGVMLIPFAGVALVPVYGVVAATLAVIELPHPKAGTTPVDDVVVESSTVEVVVESAE